MGIFFIYAGDVFDDEWLYKGINNGNNDNRIGRDDNRNGSIAVCDFNY